MRPPTPDRGTAIRIVSGGQTGADRAALDWAIRRGAEHGGWCPKGRRALDGPLPACYRLTETPTSRWLREKGWAIFLVRIVRWMIRSG
jgi:hypothetical protein